MSELRPGQPRLIYDALNAYSEASMIYMSYGSSNKFSPRTIMSEHDFCMMYVEKYLKLQNQ